MEAVWRPERAFRQRRALAPESVREQSGPATVLNMAKWRALNVRSEPDVLDGASVNVATKSSDRSAGYVGPFPRAPSTASTLPDTVAVPPPPHAAIDQSAGSAELVSSLRAGGDDSAVPV